MIKFRGVPLNGFVPTNDIDFDGVKKGLLKW